MQIIIRNIIRLGVSTQYDSTDKLKFSNALYGFNVLQSSFYHMSNESRLILNRFLVLVNQCPNPLQYSINILSKTIESLRKSMGISRFQFWQHRMYVQWLSSMILFANNLIAHIEKAFNAPQTLQLNRIFFL